MASTAQGPGAVMSSELLWKGGLGRLSMGLRKESSSSRSGHIRALDTTRPRVCVFFQLLIA